MDKLLGKNIHLNLDIEFRNTISLPHSVVHISSVFLNSLLNPYMTKGDKIRKDMLDQPNFDQESILESRLSAYTSTDTYRIGNNFKKKAGVKTEQLIKDLSTVSDQMNNGFSDFLKRFKFIKMLPDKPVHIQDKRFWVAEFDGKEVTIPCGGSHITELSDIKTVSFEIEPLTVQGSPGFKIITHLKGHLSE